jgi:hypothetical protein
MNGLRRNDDAMKTEAGIKKIKTKKLETKIKKLTVTNNRN